MIGYVFFIGYLSLCLSSVIFSLRCLWKRDFDPLPASVVLFFSCLIGLSCNYPAFIRVFAALYGITLQG